MPETPVQDPSIDGLLKSLGFVRWIEQDTEARRAVVEFEAKPEMCHSGNVVQGGFVTGWIDNAMAIASMIGPGEGRVAMTLELKISFFRSARPGPVIAEGWVEHGTGRTVFTEGLLRTPDGTPIAKGTSTIALVKLDKG